MVRRILFGTLALAPIAIGLHYLADLPETTEFVLSALALIPLALRGVGYKPMGASAVLRRNLLIYGAGGLIIPFPCMWAIDRLLVSLHLA